MHGLHVSKATLHIVEVRLFVKKLKLDFLRSVLAHMRILLTAVTARPLHVNNNVCQRPSEVACAPNVR